MTDDQPIGYALYSDYALAILHRRRLRLSWRDPDGLRHGEIPPVERRSPRGVWED